MYGICEHIYQVMRKMRYQIFSAKYCGYRRVRVSRIPCSTSLFHFSIFLSGRELSIDLVILEMRDFNIILDMDWISKYHATIDCKRKIVFFNLLERRTLSLKGRPKG